MNKATYKATISKIFCDFELISSIFKKAQGHHAYL